MKNTFTYSTTFCEEQSKTVFTKCLFFFILIFGIQNSFAQTNTWDGSNSNSWTTGSNWSQNHVPTSAEDVVIPNVGTDPRYNSAASTVKSITVQSGGNLVFERSTAYALTVTGNVTVNSGGTFAIRTGAAAATNTLNIGGDFVNNGTVDFVDNCVININFNGSSSQTISGSGATMDLYAVTLTNASTFAVNRAIDVASNWTNNGKTVSGTGSVTFGGTTSIGGTTLTAFPNLNVSGTVTQAVNTSVSGDYSQTGGTYNQNAGATAHSLTVTGNFILSGSSIFNMQTTSNGTGATTTVGGATGTTISGTATLNMDDGGAIAANLSIFQTTNFTASSTANSSTGIIDFGNEGNVKNNQFRISGNCTKTGATGRFYTSASFVNGGLVFNGSGTTQLVSIIPSTNTEYYNVTINSGAVVQLTSALTLGTASTPSSSMTVNGTLDAQAFSPAILGGNSGTFLLGSGATLQTANVNGVASGTTGTISSSFGTRTFNAAANYIFDGTANQNTNFSNSTMANLTINNTGVSNKTVTINTAAPTVTGTLAVTSGILDSGAFQIIGNATNNFTLASGTIFRSSGAAAANFPTLFTSGHCIFNAASTVEYYGTTQTINATPTYGNLNISTAGTKTAGGTLTIAGNLNITSGAIVNLGALATHTANTLTLGGVGTAAAKFGSTSTSATAPVFKNNTYFTSGTTGYITVGASSCTAPTITFGSISNICPGAVSYAIPYTAVTGAPDLYSISGTGITSVTNGVLSAPSSSITVGLSSAAVSGTISPSSFTVSSSLTGCASANLGGSVTVSSNVGTPGFTAGATTVCQDAADTTYTATATNTTGITYSVLPAGAGTIGSTSGIMNWSSTFNGSATITASAAGCSGPKTADRLVTVTPTVGTPSFTTGAITICQNAADETYAATATDATGITYSVSPGSAGTIGSANGIMNWNPTFNGNATITASAAGCNGPKTANRVVAVTPTVGTPNTPSPSASTICQASANTAYTTSATNATSYTWSVTGSGNSISGTGTTGTVTWGAGFSGSATVSVVANGCNGPSALASTTVTVTPTVVTPIFSDGDTTVCQNAADEIYLANSTNSIAITYSVSPGTAGTIGSTNGVMNWSSTFSGTATITASATGCNGPKTANRIVTVTPTVGNPSFNNGDTTVCQDSANETYTATASNNTGITYSVSPVEAGTINSSSGSMNWDADFSGSATITATVTGCNGPKTATRNVTVTPTVGTPTFTAGDTTVCQDSTNETYTATATNSTFMIYSVSPGSAGSINLFTGSMNWNSTFSGTATITASASGCNGPVTGTRLVTVTPTVGTPSFTAGATTVCQDAADETYTATATNDSGITYSVSPVGAGTIGSSSGIMNWNPAFSGTATITATAAGCNGPKTVTRLVTVTPSVGTPGFTAGATVLCQDSADETYIATAINTTGITYNVSPIGAGSIGSSTGIMNWSAIFSGTATITASAVGCNGPKTVTRNVTVTPEVGSPSFSAGATTVCQDAADETYVASASDSTGITYSVSPVGAGTIGSTNGIMNWNSGFSGTATITASAAGCSGPATANRIVTVNALPIVTASNVSGCAGTEIALLGSGIPSGGSGNYNAANPFVGTSSTTYTYTYTALNGCSATSTPANITITPQPLWYLDVDGDQYYTGSAIASCTSPGSGYTMTVFGGNDCNDNNTGINPAATDICYNNIDENCDGIFSDGCAPVVVNMTQSYHNSTLPSLSTAVPAISYSYPGTTNIKYRFSIKNVTTNTTVPDIIQTSRYITIPASIHSYNSQYTIKVSAVINEEVVAFAGNTITVNSPSIQLVTLNSVNCGATLGALTSIISANPGLNATGYTFRIRLNDSNLTSTYAYSESATRFVGANTFTGFPLQYATSYKISVQYTSTDSTTNLPVQSGYGAECIVNTPSIPLTNLASPACGSQVATMNANISSGVAAYATAYQFRIRLFSDNGPTPTYYYSVPNASRFSSLTAFQGITLAYSTDYLISVQYSIPNGSSTVWSGYGTECKVKTAFFPVTSLVPSQCGLATPTSLTQELNITPYLGFPHYRVRLEEISGEDVVNSEEKEISYSHFKLSDFSIAQLGKNYNVSVAIKLNGVFGDYDTACDMFTAESGDETDLLKTVVPFKATAYPNPFANNFMLDVKTTSQSSVNVKVYDMVGRLIEQRDVRVSDMNNTTVGSHYPSGVYNVVVSQENSVQTVRVVKR